VNLSNPDLPGTSTQVLESNLRLVPNAYQPLNPYLKAQEWGIPLAWLGDVLIAARKEQGMTQQEIASRLEVFPSAYSRWEGDKFGSTSLERLIAIAQSLELDINLVARSSQKTSKEEAK
jgi:DNA-binding XRE family transcriptional regulator